MEDHADQRAAVTGRLHEANDLELVVAVVDDVAATVRDARARLRRELGGRQGLTGAQQQEPAVLAPAGEASELARRVGGLGQPREIARERGGGGLGHHGLEGLQHEQADEREAADGHRQAHAEDAAGHRARHHRAEAALAGDVRAHRLQQAIEAEVIEHGQQERDHHNWAELPDRTRIKNETAKVRLQLPSITEDRQ